MPTEHDVTLNDHVAGGSGGDTSEDGGVEMPLAENAHEQNMTQIAQVGVVAQQNFTKVTHYTDLDYLEGKRLVSLEEAVGVREVQSQVNPSGPAPRT